MTKILVLCTGNSARSILLEYILKGLGVESYSAGSNPTGKVHAEAIRLLQGKGIDPSAARSKSWDEFGGQDAPAMDAVITVCGSAAEEVCPIWPGSPIQVHWGVEDPAAASEETVEAAFNDAFRILSEHANKFARYDKSLPLDERLKKAAIL